MKLIQMPVVQKVKQIKMISHQSLQEHAQNRQDFNKRLIRNFERKEEEIIPHYKSLQILTRPCLILYFREPFKWQCIGKFYTYQFCVGSDFLNSCFLTILLFIIDLCYLKFQHFFLFCGAALFQTINNAQQIPSKEKLQLKKLLKISV